MLEFKDELEDIKKNNISVVVLIKYVYSSYFLKFIIWEKLSDDEMIVWDLLECGIKEYKKLFVKVLVVFYFDKVNDKEYGMKWKVLSEEIIKMIINYYENIKFFF